MTEEYRINPFSPDCPVAPELFAGRAAEIGQVKAALLSTARGKSQHILIQGERWIGKSSVALYVQNMAGAADELFKGDVRFFTVFCRLGACRNLDEVCVAILDQFRGLQNTLKSKVMELLRQVNGISVGMFGVQLSKDQSRPPLVPTFPSVFEAILSEARLSHNAFLIILDETEHVSTLPGMASFLKTLFEQLQGDGYRDVMFLMTATPDAVESLADDHPSFPRLFRYVNLPSMSRDESDELFGKALTRGQPTVFIDEPALEVAHYYSDGFPGLLQEMGAAAFDVNADEVIDHDDMSAGILGREGYKGAADTLYDKHFARTLTRRLLSDRYRSILTAIATSKMEVITFSQIADRVAPEGLRPNQIGPYLGPLVQRGVLKRSAGKKGEYKLASRMLGLWLRIDQWRREQKGR